MAAPTRSKKRTGLGPRPHQARARQDADFRALCQEVWIQEMFQAVQDVFSKDNV